MILNEVAPTLNAPPLEASIVVSVLKRFAHRCYLKVEVALIAVRLLLLKAAGNKNSPLTQYVEIRGIDTELTKVYKKDLIFIFEEVTGNKFLRKLAKTMAFCEGICLYAEANGLDGDITTRLHIGLADKEQPCLTPVERAWACSSCQHFKELESRAGPRLRTLLDEDYRNRFANLLKRCQKIKSGIFGSKRKTERTRKGRLNKRRVTRY